ncbi:MAG: hypothetical protein ABFS86_00790 [Planctomycetota bacterium]
MRFLRAIFCFVLLVGLCSAVPPLDAAPPAKMELVSRLGRKTVVKIYSGESLTFRARDVRGGISSIFTSGGFLRGVSFTLREWPRVKQDAAGIVKGANRHLVREKKAEPDLWGLPASFFVVEDEPAGRYVLTAKKPGYTDARVVIDCATVNLEVNDGELTERHYTANFDVELTDPAEKGRPVPIRVECLDEDGAIVDARDDLRLLTVTGSRNLYRTNVAVHLSSRVAESFRERVKRRKTAPLPTTFFATKPMRITEGGSIRISLRNLRLVYPLPLGY